MLVASYADRLAHQRTAAFNSMSHPDSLSNSPLTLSGAHLGAAPYRPDDYVQLEEIHRKLRSFGVANRRIARIDIAPSIPRLSLRVTW